MSSIELLKMEAKRYKSLYEDEKGQFEEYQRYSKEVETELEAELKQNTKRIRDLEARNSRVTGDLDSLRTRYETERNEFLNNEKQLKTRLQSVDDLCRELRERLRLVEQRNDDLERRERIQTQELFDLSSRYEHCLERCALLEAGLVEPMMTDGMEESRRRMSVTSSSAGLNNSVFGPPLSRSDVVMSDSVQMTSYTSSSAPTQISGIAGSSGDVDEAANLNQSIFYRSGDMTNGFALNELKRQGSNFNGTTPSHHSIHSVNSLNQSQQMPSPTNSSASSSSVMEAQKQCDPSKLIRRTSRSKNKSEMSQ